jgi:transposase
MRNMPRTQPREWAPSEDEQLQAAYREGVVLREIAATLGLDIHHVFTRVVILRREGADLPPRRPRWSTEQRRLLAKMRAAGSSLRELEMEFERTRGTITSQLRTLRRLGYDLGDDQGAAARTGRHVS